MGLPRPARRRRKGVFSTVENTPFGTPRERKGCALDLPHCKPNNKITARAAQRSACSFLLPLLICRSPCGRCRSAAGFRRVLMTIKKFAELKNQPKWTEQKQSKQVFHNTVSFDAKSLLMVEADGIVALLDDRVCI